MELFASLKEETKLPPPQGFSQIWMWIVLEKQPLTPPKNAISLLLATPRIVDLPLKLDSGQVSLPYKLCHFCSYDAIENEAHFVLDCPLNNPIEDKFPSLFENVVT
jgi:hypothetical protein